LVPASEESNPTTDIDGQPRLQGSKVDAGADETG
jgi:hypothetical protein